MVETNKSSALRYGTGQVRHDAVGRPLRYKRLMALCVGGCILLALPFLGLPDFYIGLFTQAWVLAIAAMGLDLLLGYTGLVSFTHGAIFGVGAYAVAIAAVKFGLQGWLWGLGLGVGFAVAVSIIFALVSLRTLGATFIIITLALNQILWGTAQQWISLTGGDNGIVGFSRPTIFGISLESATSYYVFSLLVLFGAAAVLRMVVGSNFGLALIGIRDQPARMEALGYNPWLHRVITFILGGAFAGLGGVLFANYNLFVSPEQMHVGLSVDLLLMVVLGGRATIYGSIAGALVIVVLGNYLSGFTDRWHMILGAMYVLVVLYFDQGFAGAARRCITLLKRLKPMACGRE